MLGGPSKPLPLLDRRRRRRDRSIPTEEDPMWACSTSVEVPLGHSGGYFPGRGGTTADVARPEPAGGNLPESSRERIRPAFLLGEARRFGIMSL